jgi:uncharacterized protein (TIGR02284 family)
VIGWWALRPDRPATLNLDLAGVYEMASGTEHDIRQLNSLIEVTVDSAQGYMDAADEAKSSRFSSLFRERAAQRNEIAGRLQTRVKSHGSDPEKTGTTLGAAKRSFDNLKHMMTGTDASIIAEVEAGEDHVKEVYQKVILDIELSDPIRTAIESEFAQIQDTPDQIRDLKHAVG